MADKKQHFILGNYDVMADIRKDPVFRWVKARDRSRGNTVVLQILCAELPPHQIELLFDFFDNLRSASKSKLFLPDYTLSDYDTPLAAVYKAVPFEPLSKAMIRKPEKALEWWHGAAEQLFYLHNRNLVHGYVSPDHFILINDKIFLINFGYAPLLEAGNDLAIKKVGKFCAPEVMGQNTVTPVADVYAFAKTVAHFHPELKSSEWLRKATAEKPEDRPARMRDVCQELKKEFDKLKSKAEIIEKYLLTTETVPKEGGRADGSGKFMRSENVRLMAVAAEGYVFDHWEGDLKGKKNPGSVIMDADKKIIAVFMKDSVQSHQSENRNSMILDKFEHRMERMEKKLNKISLRLDQIQSHILNMASVRDWEKNDRQSQILLELKTIIYKGITLDTRKIEMMKKVIGTGTKSEITDPAISDFLFDLNQVIIGSAAHPVWKMFFVETISNYLSEGRQFPKDISDEKAEWLMDRIDSSGHIDENTKALLIFIKENIKIIPAKLKFKIALWNI